MASAPESYKHRIEHIYCLEDRLNNLSGGTEADLSNYALANHTHSEYALSEHEHSEYASTSHEHGEYSLCYHCHYGYELKGHRHDCLAYDICQLKCAIRILDTYLLSIWGPFKDVNCKYFYALSEPYVNCNGIGLLQRNGFAGCFYGSIASEVSMTSHENTVISE